jgi:hypothetical protein
VRSRKSRMCPKARPPSWSVSRRASTSSSRRRTSRSRSTTSASGFCSRDDPTGERRRSRPDGALQAGQQLGRHTGSGGRQLQGFCARAPAPRRLRRARLRPSVMGAWINSRSKSERDPRTMTASTTSATTGSTFYSACARSTAVLPRGFPVLPDFLTGRFQPVAWSGLRHAGGFDGLPVRGNCPLRSVFAFLEGCQSRAGTLQKMPETTRF